MRRYLLLLLAPLLLCSGCGLRESHPPLEAVEAVQTLGLDASDGTRASVTTGADAEAERLDETARTLTLALDGLRARSAHGGLFYGHTQYLLLGEDYARAGIQPLLDLTARSAELRLVTPVYVLRGTAADAVLSEELDVTARLAALSRTDLPACTALDAADRLARAGCALVGAVRYDPEAQALLPDGCAVLRGGRLAGYLDADSTEAAAWREGKGGQPLEVRGATLSVRKCAMRLSADWRDGRPAALTLTLEADALVDELPDGTRITDAAARKALEQALAETMLQRTADAVRQTQALGADALALGDLLALRYPLRWRGCAGEWAALFPALPVRVAVTARITGTQDLNDPLPKEKDA